MAVHKFGAKRKGAKTQRQEEGKPTRLHHPHFASLRLEGRLVESPAPETWRRRKEVIRRTRSALVRTNMLRLTHGLP